MYVCKDCRTIFEDPKNYIETHGFSSPPYEQWSGCPQCGGAYTETFICDGCNAYIVDDYIRTADGSRYCEDCYAHYELGEE